MIIQTTRFEQLNVNDEETIIFPQGLFGFVEYTQFCLVDACDDVLILWLQSLEKSEIAFPVLEPKIFKPDYTLRLSPMEMRELRLDNIQQAVVLSILTIPTDVNQMTANLKAPLVLNLKEQIAKQVVLQENEYPIKYPMFKEFKAHLVTLQANRSRTQDLRVEPKTATQYLPIPIKNLFLTSSF